MARTRARISPVIHMQVAVLHFVVFAHEHVAEKVLQETGLSRNSLGHVTVIRTDECIPEKPGIVCKNLIIYLKTQGAKVLYHENGGGSGVPFAKGMDLP